MSGRQLRAPSACLSSRQKKKPKQSLGLESTKEGGGDEAIIGEALLQCNIVVASQQLTLFSAYAMWRSNEVRSDCAQV